MLPWQIDEEIALLSEDLRILPSRELLDHAWNNGWIGLRHINVTANLADTSISTPRQRALVYEIQARLFRGYIKELISRIDAT